MRRPGVVRPRPTAVGGRRAIRRNLAVRDPYGEQLHIELHGRCADLEEFARPMMVPDQVQEVPILVRIVDGTNSMSRMTGE